MTRNMSTISEELLLCSKKCRLCLRYDKFQISIFGDVARELEIYLKIKTCLPIEISQEDAYPKNICYKCMAALDQSYNLWKVSSASQTILKKLSSRAHQEMSYGKRQQHQGFHGQQSPYYSPPRAANQRLLLPSGMPLIVESDSDEENGRGQSKSQPATTEVSSLKWLWTGEGHESETVTMDISPDFMDCPSQPTANTNRGFVFGDKQNEAMATDPFPHMLERPPSSCTNRNTAHSSTELSEEDGTEQQKGNRWQRLKLFDTSVSAWRDSYRLGRQVARDSSGETSNGDNPLLDGPPASTSRTNPGRDTAASLPVPGERLADALQALNERNCKAISKNNEAPASLLDFLRNQKPWAHNTPQQEPK